MMNYRRIFFDFMLLLLLMQPIGYIYAVQTNLCTAVKGTESFPYLLNLTLTNPEQNTAGFISAHQNWNLKAGNAYTVNCHCSADKKALASLVTYFKTTIPMEKGDTENYYKLNDNLEISVELYLAGARNEFILAPFDNESDYGTKTDVCSETETDHVSYASSNTPSLSTGSQGRIKLRFKKAFIGQSSITPTSILKIYASLDSNQFSTQPVAQVILSGTITVPQSCKFDQQGIMTINFGNIASNDFIDLPIGSRPPKTSSKIEKLTYTCTEINANTLPDIKLITQKSAAQNSIATYDSNGKENSHIGIIVADKEGKRIKPNIDTLPMTIDLETQKGEVTIESYPIKIHDGLPSLGALEAQATLRIEFP